MRRWIPIAGAVAYAFWTVLWALLLFLPLDLKRSAELLLLLFVVIGVIGFIRSVRAAVRARSS